jgi:hypothetical protein
MKINYEEVTIFPHLSISECPKCGALLINRKLHTEYHESLMKVKDFMDQHQVKS